MIVCWTMSLDALLACLGYIAAVSTVHWERQRLDSVTKGYQVSVVSWFDLPLLQKGFYLKYLCSLKQHTRGLVLAIFLDDGVHWESSY